MRGRDDKYTIMELLLRGQNATNLDFKAAVKETLGPVTQKNNDGEGGPLNPLFDVARDVALYSRRRQESHFDCEEEPEFEERRKRERGIKSVKVEL